MLGKSARRTGEFLMEDEIDKRESEKIRVYTWRVEQLKVLGVSPVIASAVANMVDWHDVERLVHRGCPPELALDIAR
jgi:hypothetical protein